MAAQSQMDLQSGCDVTQHRYRRDNKRFAVVFRDGHWVRTNFHGEVVLVSPRFYHLPPGLFHNRRERQDAIWAGAAAAGGFLLGVLMTRAFSRG